MREDSGVVKTGIGLVMGGWERLLTASALVWTWLWLAERVIAA